MPMLNVENMSSSAGPSGVAHELEDRGLRPRSTVELRAHALGERPRQVLVETPTGDVRGGMHEPAACEGQHDRCVDRTRLEELFGDRANAPELGRRFVEAAPGEQRVTHQRVAVGVQPARREPDQHVDLSHATRTQQRRIVDGPDAEPGQIERIVGHRARMLRRLAAEQRASGPPASLRHSFDDRGDALGHDLADGEVVEEEQRLRAGAHDVVGAHRHQVDADRVEPTDRAGDLELRAHAIGRRRQQPAAADAEQAREPADLVGHLGAARPRGEVADQADGFRGRIDVDAGAPVGLGHRGVPASPAADPGPVTRSAAGADPPARTCRPAPARRSGTRRRSMLGNTTPWARPPP